MLWFFFYLQSSPPESLSEKLLLIVVSSVLSAGLAWFFTRRQNAANAGKTESEIIGNWQDKYFGLQGKLEEIKVKAEAVEEELDAAKKRLRTCLTDKGDCREVIGKINPIFEKAEVTLKDFVEHAALLNEIRELRGDIEGIHKTE